MTIRVKAGVLIVNDGSTHRTYTKADGPFDLSSDLEARFVRKGAAEYVGAEPIRSQPKPAPVMPIEHEQVDESAEYSSMSLEALKAEMRTRGIKLQGKLTRSKIIDALNQDDEPPAINAMELES